MFKPKLDTSGQNWTVTWTEIGRLWTASYQRLWTFWILKLGKNKKIFSDLLQNFSNFFLKFRVFCNKPSRTKGYECVNTVQFPVQFHPILQKHVQIVDFHQKYRKSLSFCSNLWNPNIRKENPDNVCDFTEHINKPTILNICHHR